MCAAKQMPPSDGAATDVAADASFVALLREHADLRRKLIVALRSRVDAPAGATATPDLERRTSDLVGAVAAHLGGIVAEAIRRGASQTEVEAWFALAAPDLVRLDLAHPFAEAFPGGATDAALKAWRVSATAGSAPAGHVAGVAVLHLAKTKQEGNDALNLIEGAAAAGSIGALEELGEHEVDVDPAKAAELFRKAADAGSARAGLRLVSIAGRTRVQRLAVGDAIEYLEKAAGAGDAEAQLEVGRIRATGALGLPIDFEQAHRWISLAAKQHRLVAREWLEKYGAMDADTYRSAVWVDSWTPTSLPTPPRAGKLAVLVSVGVLALLVAGALQGSSIGLFLLLTFIAILMHEAGHFLAARMVGVPIAVFSVGVGPLVRSFRGRSGRLPMRVDLRLLPLMGSVQPYEAPRGVWLHWHETARRERAGEPPPALPRFDASDEPGPVFLHVSKGRRLAFLAGGLVVNFVAATAFFWVYAHGSPEARLVTSPEAGRVPPGSVAAAAGVREGDRFVAVDGRPVAGFFDVRRRLAPIDDAGKAKALPDAPGHSVRIDVRRGEAGVVLTWTTPSAPPAGNATDAYGLLPAESWQISRLRRGILSDLQIGDEVVGFVAGGRDLSADAPGAHAALREAMANGGVELRVRRAGQEHRTSVDPWRPDTAASPKPPFEFARKREPGEPDGLSDALGRVWTVGWNSIVALPRTIADSFRSTPSREEQGWLVAAVRRDPWQAADLFAFLHAFLLFLNLLPIPPLDGFQLACLGVESAAGRPLPRRGVAVVRRAGFILLSLWLALNAFLILRDAVGAVL